MPRRSASGANASTRRPLPSSFRRASTSVSSGSGAIICNIARAAFGAAESMSRKSRSEKQPENRGRKRHAKFFGGGAAGHRGGRVQRARKDRKSTRLNSSH